MKLSNSLLLLLIVNIVISIFNVKGMVQAQSAEKMEIKTEIPRGIPLTVPAKVAVRLSQPLTLPTVNLDITSAKEDALAADNVPPILKNIHKKFPVKRADKVFKNKHGSVLERTYTLEFNDNVPVQQIIQELKQYPEVEQASPVFLAKTQFQPNDPMVSNQWALAKTQAFQGWDRTTGNAQIIIADIDTGVDYPHEDLIQAMVDPCTSGCPSGKGYDFVDIDIADYVSIGCSSYPGEDYTGVDAIPTDVVGHGTHVAGIIAATANNNLGISGVCPGCKILPVRSGFAINYQGQPTGLFEHDDLAASIVYAADNGAKIISLSLGGPADDVVLKPAIDYAVQRGVLIVAAAGNENSKNSNSAYPAAYPNVMAVSASTQTDIKASFSNYGFWTDVTAPGESILSTVPRTGIISNSTGYANASGTSMATPFVSGLAGLILSQNPSLNANQVARIITTGVDELPQRTYYIGSGRVNVAKALAIERVSTAEAIITDPANDSTINRLTLVRGTAAGDSYRLD